MENNKANKNFGLYSKEILEFATIGVAFAQMIESEREKDKFIKSAINIIPRLYAMIKNLPDYSYNEEEDYIETYVDEQTYLMLSAKIAELLGEDDSFLTAQDENIEYSEKTLLASVSEYLMDAYQHIGNLLGIIREENELALFPAIGRMQKYFYEYFGAHLLEALLAIHKIDSNRYMSNEDFLENNENDGEEQAYFI